MDYEDFLAPPKPKRTLRRILLTAIPTGIILALLIILATTVFIRAMDGVGAFFDNPQCDPSDPSGIQDLTQITLPPSYSNLHATCGGLPSWWAETRFDLPPDELDTFLASTRITPEDLTPEMEGLPRSLVLEEYLELVETYLYGSYESMEWAEEIIVDTSNPDQWTVYFSVVTGG